MIITVFNYTHTIGNVFQFYLCRIHGFFIQTVTVFQLCQWEHESKLVQYNRLERDIIIAPQNQFHCPEKI